MLPIRDSRPRPVWMLITGAAALFATLSPVARAEPGEAAVAATVAVQAVAPTGDGRARVSECSGVLIARDLVLTAGHCLDIAGDPSRVAVFAYRGGRPAPQPLRVASFARHPSHVVGWRETPGDPETRQAEISADLALVRLVSPIADAKPIAFGAPPADEGAMAGTGAAGASKRSGAMKRARLVAVRISSGAGARVAFATASATVCGGDSGGPAAAARADGTAVLWGVVVAVLKPRSGCGTRLAIALVGPDTIGFAAMRSATGAR